MKLIVCIVLTLTLSNVFGQESNNGKKLWADSFLNKKAPEFVVEEWISQQPKLKGKFILIDFWATWCGPCKKIAPDVEALAEEYKDQVIIGKCDVDDNDELTGKFGVRNIPTVLFIKDGEVKDKTVGAVTKAQLEEKIKALL